MSRDEQLSGQPTLSGGINRYDPRFPPTPDLAKREDLMHPRGRLVPDYLYAPLLSATQFLCASCYMKIQVLLTSNEIELSQMHPVIEFWANLAEAKNTANVYALLPDPNNKKEMYVFFNNMIRKVDTTSKTQCNDEVLKDSSPIIDKWRSLKAAGFSWVDAVLPYPQNKNKLWFFKKINLSAFGLASKDFLLSRPIVITDGWKSLRAAGFETVAAFVPNVQCPDWQAWVFSGNKYAFISISADTVLFGPSLIPEDWILHYIPEIFVG